MWWWYWDSVNVRVQSGVNDDAAATLLIFVLKAAKRTLVIHDDGNKHPETVYDNECVIDAVRRRLAENQELGIRCLFNDRDDLELVRQMCAEYPDRFKVWYGDRLMRPDDDIHYKIADGGAVGHLSWHEHMQPEREFKLLDCSGAKPRTRKRAFGKYLDQFERHVTAAG